MNSIEPTGAGGPLIIRADASARIGAGHAMRCLGLAQAARAAGVAAYFAACELPEIFSQRLRDEGHEVYQIDATPGSAADADFTVKLAAEKRAGTIVADLYDASPAYLEMLSAGRSATLCIDDNAALARYPVDFILNVNAHAEASHYAASKAAETRLLLGPQYALLRREFLAFRGWTRNVPEQPRSILLSFGGGNQVPAFVRLINGLASVLKPFALSFVLGQPDLDTTLLDTAAQNHGLTHRLLIAPPDMAAEYARHDVLISSGGSSVWEAWFMQMPAVFIAIAENQRRSCAAVQKLTGQPVFTSLDGIDPAVVSAFLGDHRRRAALSGAGRSMVDGFGAKRVVDALLARA